MLRTIVSIQENKLYIQHLFDFLNLEQKITDPSTPTSMPTRIETLSLEGVYFTYPMTNKEVLSDISFSVKKGEIIAIVGENGSGKTTLNNLLSLRANNSSK